MLVLIITSYIEFNGDCIQNHRAVEALAADKQWSKPFGFPHSKRVPSMFASEVGARKKAHGLETTYASVVVPPLLPKSPVPSLE